MKTVMMMIFSLTSMSAMASEATLLTYTNSNGSVAPTYHYLNTCNITETSTHMITKQGVDSFPREISKPTVFTSTIPNVNVLKSLVNEAAQHEVQKNPPRMGGNVQAYTAQYDGKEIMLLLKNGSLIGQINPSTSAAELVEFMKINCGVYTIL